MISAGGQTHVSIECSLEESKHDEIPELRGCTKAEHSYSESKRTEYQNGASSESVRRHPPKYDRRCLCKEEHGFLKYRVRCVQSTWMYGL